MNNLDFLLPARIVGGLAAASRNLALQLPLIAEQFPKVAGCHPGTINLVFDQPLTVTSPDHRTPPLAWVPGRPQTEVFDFVRIELVLPHRSTPERAWLYVAHRSPHRSNACLHEVIAKRQDLQGARSFRIRMPSAAFGWAGTRGG